MGSGKEKEGTAWLFYRPANNASLVQEWNWDAATNPWSRGSSFEGIATGSSIFTLVTPQWSASRHCRLFAGCMASDGMVVCMNGFAQIAAPTPQAYGKRVSHSPCTTFQVQPLTRYALGSTTYTLPQADPDSLALSGRTNDSARVIYYRGLRGAILNIRSSITDYKDQENGDLSSQFESDMNKPSQHIGTYLEAVDRMACSLTTYDGEEVCCMYPWADGHVKTINVTIGPLEQDVPTANEDVAA